MISLTFGEQVKIILSRKGMTIKELAELIEERTGKKMSRQNLTQRLGRDNFQEQDMRMIAEILGCSFQLSILASAEAVERASVIEEVVPTDKELHRLAVKKEQKRVKEEARDITVGEFVEMLENPMGVGHGEVKLAEETVDRTDAPDMAEAVETDDAETELAVAIEVSEEPSGEQQETESENLEAVAEEAETGTEEVSGGPSIMVEEVKQEVQPEPVKEEEKRGSKFSKITNIISGPRKEETRKPEQPQSFEPIKKRNDEDENREIGDVNPYTGHEYQTNSVRMHPKRIGYVQVYDRKEHKWTDMTEWAFLGVEERKRAMLGKDYEPPIYLD